MSFVDNVRAMFSEALCDLEWQLEQEMGRVGRRLLRWLADLWPRMPCDTWRGEFDRIVADLATEELFVEEQSRRDFIAWLGEINASAAIARAEGLECPPAPTRFYTREQLEYPGPPQFPNDKPAPFDPDYPQLRGSGNAIMEAFWPTTWHEHAVVTLESYRVPQEIADAFVQWIDDEQQKALAHAVDSLPPRLRKLLGEVLAEIDKQPPQERLEEVRTLLRNVNLPPELETWILAYYTGLHERWMQTWGLLHLRGLREPAPTRPETPAELLLRVVAGLDKLVAEGRLDELVSALRELARRLPEFIPEGGPEGQFADLSRELQMMLGLFVDLLELLPPEAGEVAIELLQVAIGIAGLIPGAGEPFDLISAVISGRRGEWGDVILSGLSLIPVAGVVTGSAKTADEAFELLRKTMDDVEDTFSGVAKAKNPGLKYQGRMYPPTADFTTRLPNGGIEAVTAGNVIRIDPNGTIRIFAKNADRSAGKLILEKLGGG